MKKKILHISHLYPTQEAPYLGSFMKELHDGLNKIYDVTFIVPVPFSIPFTKKFRIGISSFLTANKVTRIFYFSIPKRYAPKITQFFLHKSILSKIKKVNYALIHVHWSYPETLLIPKLKELGIPIINTLHGYSYYQTVQRKSLKPHLEQAFKKTDQIITVGKKLQADITKEFPFVKEKCINIGNGIDQDKFNIGDRNYAQSKLGWNSDHKHILCIAHIAYEKGIDILVESFLSLPNKKLHLHLVGRSLDPHLTKSVKNLIQRNLLKNITYHGPIAHNKLHDFYVASNLFVLPSRNEGFGVALVEAGMCGLPLLSTLSGGPEDIITLKSGILVKKNDADKLEKGLTYMLSNLELYTAQEIRETMIERFSKEKISSKLESIYGALLGKSTSS